MSVHRIVESLEGTETHALIRTHIVGDGLREKHSKVSYVEGIMRVSGTVRFVIACIMCLFGSALCTANAFAQSTAGPEPSIINLATPIPGVVTVNLPRDIPLVVETAESINSYSAATGERVKYRVLQDFIVGGYLIAKAGDEAEGMVQEGQQGKAGFYGIGYKAANLRVSVDKIFTFCGSTLQVDFDRSEYRRRQGFMGSNKDVGVAKGQQYVPTVDHPQQVCAVKTDEKALPIPKDALHADKG
ncbi:MAG TPA: hypothetical protein VGG22_14300 [Candidatus Baltobacteraceae bacterium]